MFLSCTLHTPPPLVSPPLCPLPLQAAALRWQTHHLAHHPWHLKGTWHRIALNESVFAQRIYAGFPRDTDRSLFFCSTPLTQHSVLARTYQLYSNEIEAPIKIHATRMCFESRASRLRSHQYLNKSIRLLLFWLLKHNTYILEGIPIVYI